MSTHTLPSSFPSSVAVSGAMQLSLLLMACVGVAVAAKSVLIGIPYTKTGKWAHTGAQTQVAADMWKQHVKDIGGIGSTGLEAEVVMVDVGQSTATTKEVVAGMIAGNFSGGRPISLLLAPYSSTLTPTAAAEAVLGGKLMIAPGSSATATYRCDERLLPGCVSPGTKRFPRLYGVYTPAEQYMRPFISAVALKGATSIALLAEDVSFTVETCQGAEETAIARGLNVVSHDVVRHFEHAEETKEADDNTLREAVQRLKALRPDVLVGCVYQETCYRLVEIAEEENFNVKALGLTSCVGDPHMPIRLGFRADHIVGSSQWHPDLRGLSFTEEARNVVAMFPVSKGGSDSPRQFWDKFLEVAGEHPSYQGAGVLAALYLLHAGIALANATEPDLVDAALQNLQLDSFFGVLRPDAFGANREKTAVTLQYGPQNVGGSDQGNVTIHIIHPLEAASRDLFYPMPTWAERRGEVFPTPQIVYVEKRWSATEIVLGVMGTLVGVCLLFLCGYCVARARGASTTSSTENNDSELETLTT